MNSTLKIASGSIAVGVVVLLLKLAAWRLTDSVALLSDALESTVNVATAIAALIAIRVAARPADEGHPYGHHKAEFFSAVLEGVMIILAALLIMHEAWKGFFAPPALNAPFPGLAVNALAGLINGLWCWVLISRGRQLASPALVADGKHLLTDVFSSLGVLARGLPGHRDRLGGPGPLAGRDRGPAYPVVRLEGDRSLAEQPDG